MLIMQFVSRQEWGARAPRYTNPLNLSKVDKYIVHYSGASRSQSVRSIQNYSMDTKGYSDIDYNYIVKDGLIYVGRGDNIGGHTYQNNSSSYGVCVIGEDGDATDADFQAVRNLFDHLCERVGRWLRPMGHMDANPGQTDCPGSQIETWVKAGMPLPGGSGDEDMELVKKIQQALKDAGFDPGPVDGEWGPRTNAAFVAALKATGPAPDLSGRQITLTGTIA